MSKQLETANVRVWVSGATGYTGKALVRLLSEMGVHVVGHIRPNSPSLDASCALFESQGVIARVVPWEKEALVEAMKSDSITHVFSLLGTTAKKGRQAKSRGEVVNYQTIDLGLTRMLLESSMELTSCQRFIYLSAIGVSESSRSPYMRARWEAEEAVRSSTIAYTIAQPSLITGSDREESRPMEHLASWLSKGVLGAARILGGRSFHDRYQTLDASMLARGLIHGGLHPSGENQTLQTDELVTHGERLDV